MIIAETDWQKMTETRKLQRKAKVLKWASIVFAFVALGTTIGWLNSYEPLAKDWSIIANVATAAGTLGLAFFAVLAWHNSTEQLRSMESQIETQRVDNENAIKAARDLAIHSRQTEYLAPYCASLMDVCNAAVQGVGELNSLHGKCTSMWMIWAMELFRTDNDFRVLIGRWNEYIRNECDALEVRINRSKSEDEKFSHANDLLLVGGKFIANLQIWQVDESRREEMRTRFLKLDEVKLRRNKEDSKISPVHASS